jgi:hypothetical protein
VTTSKSHAFYRFYRRREVKVHHPVFDIRQLPRRSGSAFAWKW